MSDRDGIKELVEALNPTGRATVAYLAAARLADICADERFAEHFSYGPRMYSQALEAGHALATGGRPTVDMKILQQEFAELLGLGEPDAEEPAGAGVWFGDGLAAAYYATSAWAQPHDSARWCDHATQCLYSSVDYLADELQESQPDSVVAELAGHDLVGWELAREREDIALIGASADHDRPAVVADLLARSQELGRRYGAVFRLVTAA